MSYKFFVLSISILFAGCFNFQSKLNKKNGSLRIQKQGLSCSGSGIISVNTGKYNNLHFSYISQNDSSVIFFKDIFGRKNFILFILKDSIVFKDIFRKKIYNYDLIKNLYPSIIFLEKGILNKFLCNELNEPININHLRFNPDNIFIEFQRENKQKIIDFFDIKSNSLTIDIRINNRIFNNHKKNLKGIWRNFNI